MEQGPFIRNILQYRRSGVRRYACLANSLSRAGQCLAGQCPRSTLPSLFAGIPNEHGGYLAVVTRAGLRHQAWLEYRPAGGLSGHCSMGLRCCSLTWVLSLAVVMPMTVLRKGGEQWRDSRLLLSAGTESSWFTYPLVSDEHLTFVPGRTGALQGRCPVA